MADDIKVVINAVLNSSEFKSGIKDMTGAAGTSSKSIAKSFFTAQLALGLLKKAATLAWAAIKIGINTAKDFEFAIAKVGAVIGGSTDKLAKFARQAGRDTIFSATQAAEALKLLAQAGLTADQAGAALTDTLNLAAAADIELARATDITVSALKQFGISANNTSRVTDVLAQTARKSNTNIDELGFALQYAGPAAAVAGASIEDTAAIIGSLADIGIKGTSAGTQLRQMFAQLMKPTSEAQKILKGYGITQSEINELLPTPIELMKRLSSANMTQADMLAILGVRQAGLTKVIKDGIPAMGSLRDAISEAGGTAKDMADKQLDTLEGRLRLLKSASEELTLSLDSRYGVTGAIKNLVLNLTTFVKRISEAEKAEGKFQHFIGLTNEQIKSNLELRRKSLDSIAKQINEKEKELNLEKELAQFAQGSRRERKEQEKRIKDITVALEDLNRVYDDTSDEELYLLNLQKERQKELESLENSTTLLSEATDDLSGATGDLTGNTKNLVEAEKLAESAIAITTASYEKMGEALAAVGGDNGEIAQTIAQFVALKKQMETLNAAADQTAVAADKVANSWNKVLTIIKLIKAAIDFTIGGLRTWADILDYLGRNNGALQRVGTALARIADVMEMMVTGSVAKIIKGFIDIKKGSDELTTSLNKNNTSIEEQITLLTNENLEVVNRLRFMRLEKNATDDLTKANQKLSDAKNKVAGIDREILDLQSAIRDLQITGIDREISNIEKAISSLESGTALGADSPFAGKTISDLIALLAEKEAQKASFDDSPFAGKTIEDLQKILAGKEIEKTGAVTEETGAQAAAEAAAAAAKKVKFDNAMSTYTTALNNFNLKKQADIQQYEASREKELKEAEKIFGRTRRNAAIAGINTNYDSLVNLVNARQFDQLPPTIDQFATGGRPPIHTPSLIGERGAELFVPDTAGTIIPNNILQDLNLLRSPVGGSADNRRYSETNDNRNIVIKVEGINSPEQFVNQLKQRYGLDVFGR